MRKGGFFTETEMTGSGWEVPMESVSGEAEEHQTRTQQQRTHGISAPLHREGRHDHSSTAVQLGFYFI